MKILLVVFMVSLSSVFAGNDPLSNEGQVLSSVRKSYRLGRVSYTRNGDQMNIRLRWNQIFGGCSGASLGGVGGGVPLGCSTGFSEVVELEGLKVVGSEIVYEDSSGNNHVCGEIEVRNYPRRVIRHRRQVTTISMNGSCVVRSMKENGQRVARFFIQ